MVVMLLLSFKKTPILAEHGSDHTIYSYADVTGNFTPTQLYFTCPVFRQVSDNMFYRLKKRFRPSMALNTLSTLYADKTETGEIYFTCPVSRQVPIGNFIIPI